MGIRVDIPTDEHWHPGEDKAHALTSTDATVNLDGWALKYSIRATRGGATVADFTDKTVGSGITLSSSGAGTNNVATVDIDAADTTGLSGKYWYVFERTDTNNKGVLAEGTIPFDDIGL